MGVQKKLRRRREADISTFKNLSKEDPRVQGEDVHKGWACCDKKEEKQKENEVDALSYNLTKDEILKNKKLYNKIFLTGNWVKGKHIVIYYVHSESRKVGFAVSKKVPTNVAKNRIKRRLRELYRLKKDIFPEKGYFVILGFDSAKDCTQADLEEDYISILKEVKKRVGTGKNAQGKGGH